MPDLDYVIDLNSNLYNTEAWEGESIVVCILHMAHRKEKGLAIKGLSDFLDNLVNLLSAGF